MIVGARVDFRLIHGQVGNLWANARQVSRFMVVDDQVSQDATQKQVLRMATPATCKLSVLPVEKAAANLLAGKYDDQRLFIVVKKPEVYVKLAKAGVKFDQIILGNLVVDDHEAADLAGVGPEVADLAVNQAEVNTCSNDHATQLLLSPGG